jgi:hypothetical protein
MKHMLFRTTSLTYLTLLATLSLGCGSVVTETPRTNVCEPQLEWQLDFPGEEGPLFHQALHDDGRFVAAGYRKFNAAGEHSGVVAVDPAGTLLWQTNVPARWAEIAPYAGGYAVAGAIFEGLGSAGPDIEVTRLSAQGVPSWTARVGTENEEYVNTVVADGDALFVVGSTTPYSDASDLIISRIDASGTVQWTKVFGEVGQWGQIRDERPIAARMDQKGRVVVAAQRWIDGGGGPPWVFAVDAEGNLAWEYLDTVEHDRGSDWVFIAMKDGTFVVAGNVYSMPGYSLGPARVARLDAEGAPLWVVSLDDGSGRQQLMSAGLEAADGGIALAGYSANSTRSRLWKLHADGSIAWIHDYEDEIGIWDQMRPMPDGGFALVAGETDYPNEIGDYQIVRTWADGEVAWTHTSSASGLALGGDLGVDPDGRLFMAAYWTSDEVKRGRLLELDETCRER